MKNLRHILQGSAAVVAIVFLLTFLATVFVPVEIEHDRFKLSVFQGFLGSVTATLILVFWSIPIHLLLKKYKLSNLGWYLLVALPPSISIALLVKFISYELVVAPVTQIMFCCFLGFLVATVFWYIVVHKH